MILISYFLPLLLFVPGAVLFYLISLTFKLALSKLEMIILGSAFWGFLLVICSYIIGIFTYAMREFFIIFAGLSVFLLIYGAYYTFKQKNHVGLFLKSFKARNSNNAFLLLLVIPLIILIFTLTTTHSIFNEFDAIFFYLPSAKSMAHTGSLQFDYYRQSGLATTTCPATPIIYAWLTYMIDDPASLELAMRFVPFAYILLTSVLVYLLTWEVSKNSTTAIIGSIIFLCLPVVFSMASSYSLYLDIPFTFLLVLNIYILQKIRSAKNARSFWWGMLGIASATMLLEKELGYFILPSLFALVLANTRTHVGKIRRVILVMAISIFFFCSYNFFFIWDICHSSSNIVPLIYRQLPIFLLSAIFFVLLLKIPSIDVPSEPKKKYVAFLVIPFTPVIIFLLRNLYSFGVITHELPLFNSSWKTAIVLMGQSEASSLSSDVVSFFRWDVLLTSLSLGVVFLFPVMLGLSETIHSFFSKRTDRRDYFLLFSTLLIIIAMWSWIFECGYVGAEMRRLYYFAPLFSLFGALGVNVVANHINIKKSLTPRFVTFIFLVFVYLLLFKFGLISSNTEQLRVEFVSMKIANVEEWTLFAIFFFVPFFPVNLVNERNVSSKSKRLLLQHGSMAISILVISAMVFSVAPLSLSMLSNPEKGIRYVYSHWENDLNEVISYISQNITDNSTIITCYAPEIAYFTNHPVIEVTQYDGVATLLSLFANSSDPDQIVDVCVKQNVRCLLIPKLGNSQYDYFINLSRSFSLLSMNFISENPSIVLLQEFSKFKLYRVITPPGLSAFNEYPTFFGNCWVPLNNCSKAISSTKGTSMKSEGCRARASSSK